MPDFKNGKIYKLWCHETDEIYIGSTTQTLGQRLSKHKAPSNSSSSKFLFEKSNNVMIELIELYPCENKMELTKKEGEYIRELDCINKVIAGRTVKEWKEDNPEYHVEYKKEYYKNNKEVITEKSKEYRKNNREAVAKTVKKYFEKNKEAITEYNKEYCKKNKEAITEYNKEYREKNKEAITKKELEKITCEFCNCKISRTNFSIHTKSLKHQGAVTASATATGSASAVTVSGSTTGSTSSV